MKTALITVDPTDDLISLRDKLAWAKTPRALLIWPEGGCHLRSRLDFVRLRRSADALGMQIAVITAHCLTRAVAAEAKIPVFADRTEALRRGWRWRKVRVKRRRRRRSLAKLRAAALASLPKPLTTPKRLAFFALGVVAVLLLAAAFVPKATVRLKPRSTVRTVSFTAIISPEYSTVTANGHMPARQVSVTLGGELETPVSGVMAFPKSPAEGSVVFTNLTLQEVEIPAGTTIRSVSRPKVEFETTRSGTLPAGAGEQITLPVRARALGTEGNLPADDLQILQPPLAFQATVTNPAPTSGGTDISVPAPTEDDYRRAESALLTRLQAKALGQIQAAHKGDLVLLPSLHPAETLERTFTPPADSRQPANSLRVGLRIRFTALLVSQRDLEALVRTLLMASRPDGMEPVAESLVVKPQGKGITGEKPPFRWEFSAREVFSVPVDRERIAAAVLGESVTGAQERLQRILPLAEPPRVEISPRWWFLLPLFPARIGVIVTVPQAQQ